MAITVRTVSGKGPYSLRLYAWMANLCPTGTSAHLWGCWRGRGAHVLQLLTGLSTCLAFLPLRQSGWYHSMLGVRGHLLAPPVYTHNLWSPLRIGVAFHGLVLFCYMVHSALNLRQIVNVSNVKFLLMQIFHLYILLLFLKNMNLVQRRGKASSYSLICI